MRRTVKAVLVGATVFGTTVAAAATLGLESASLGAGSTVVEACSSAVGTDYTTEFTIDHGYVIQSVVLTGLSGCGGFDASVAFVSGGDDATPAEVLTEVEHQIPVDTDGTSTIDLNPLEVLVRADQLDDIAVVIAG